jgi:hypothetical protein
LAGTSVKLPPVIDTFDVAAIEFPERKRHAAMRAIVAKRERAAMCIAPYYQREG